MLIDKDMVIKALHTEINDAKVIHSTYARFVPVWILENALKYLECHPISPKSSQVKAPSKKCAYCNGYLVNTWKWCPHCGRGINWNETN